MGSLFIHYQPLIKSLLEKGQSASELFFDLKSGAWMICYETAQQYMSDRNATYGTFFKHSITNFRNSLLRKRYTNKRKAMLISEPYDALLHAQKPAKSTSPVVNLIAHEALTTLPTILSSAEFSVFCCLYHDNLSIEEIANKLARTKTWVYNTKARLKNKVKHHIK